MSTVLSGVEGARALVRDARPRYLAPMQSNQVDRVIQLALDEDLGTGDLTTVATIDADAVGSAVLVAKAPIVIAGMPYFARVFELLDPRVEVDALVPEGAAVEPGTQVASVEGPTRSILVGERTALNILQRTCGTATMTRRFADALEGSGTKVVDTRKTTPGMRVMQKYAVRTAGGANHRMSLDSGVLIKENHIAACGGVPQAVARARALAPHLVRVEIEVRDLEELARAIDADADVVLLDNMDTATLKRAVAQVKASGKPIKTEASGNMTLARMSEIATTGVDFVSVGALTHSAPAADLSLLMKSLVRPG